MQANIDFNDLSEFVIDFKNYIHLIVLKNI